MIDLPLNRFFVTRIPAAILLFHKGRTNSLITCLAQMQVEMSQYLKELVPTK